MALSELLNKVAETTSSEEKIPARESLQDKIEFSIQEHVRKELQKGKKLRVIKREVFRKTGIQI